MVVKWSGADDIDLITIAVNDSNAHENSCGHDKHDKTESVDRCAHSLNESNG